MATADQVVVELRANTAAYVRNIKQAQTQFDGATADMEKKAVSRTDAITRAFERAGRRFTTLAILYGARKVFDEIRNSVDSLGKIGDVADRIGITTKALQEYIYAGRQANLTTEDVSNMLEFFARKLGGAQKAGSDLGQILRLNKIQLGSLEETLPKVADLFAKATPEQKEVLTMAAFGRSAREAGTLFADGAAGVRKYAEEADRLGIIVGDNLVRQAQKLDEEFNRLEATLSHAFEEFALSAAPTAIGALQDITNAIKDITYRVEQFKKGNYGESLGISVVNPFDKDAMKAAQLKGGVERALKEGIVNSSGATQAATDEFYNAVHGVKSAPATGKGAGIKTPLGPAQRDAFQNATRAIRDHTEATKVDAETTGRSTFEVERARAELTLEQAALEAYGRITPKVRDQIETLSKTYAYQVEVLAEVQKQQEAVTAAANDSFAAVRDGFADVILGARDFKTALADVLDQFARIAINSAFTNLFQPGVGGGKGGGFFDLLGKIFTGGHAMGGVIPAGHSGTSNENEVVKATTRGAVIIPVGGAAGPRSSGGAVTFSPTTIIQAGEGGGLSREELVRFITERDKQWKDALPNMVRQAQADRQL